VYSSRNHADEGDVLFALAPAFRVVCRGPPASRATLDRFAPGPRPPHHRASHFSPRIALPTTSELIARRTPILRTARPRESLPDGVKSSCRARRAAIVRTTHSSAALAMHRAVAVHLL
jgi:hypothetical protein